MSFHSTDVWPPYTDMHQSSHMSQGRRPSHNLYGPPEHQSAMSFPDSFGPQPSPLSIQTGNLSNAAAHQQQESATTPTPYGPPFTGESVARFLTQQNDTWNPLRLAPQNLNTPVGQNSMQQPQFNNPRSPAQSDTASFVTGPRQQDSAYCSNASPTVPDPVTTNQDCPEMRELFSDTNPFSPSSDSPSTPIRSKRPPTSVPGQADEGSITLPEDGKCTFCGKEPRLKSELKKHMLRHIRPFRCKLPDCNGATEGFTTSNDLDRHNRSVHGIFPKNAKVYICAAKNCAEGEKRWPRYDNFKQHCERMHKGDSLEALIHRSERSAPPPPAEVQQILEQSSQSQMNSQQNAPSDSASAGPNDPFTSQPSFNPAFYDTGDLYGGSETGSFVSFPPHSSNYNDDPSTRLARNVARDQLRQGYHSNDGRSLSSAKQSSQGSRSVSSRPPPEVVVHQPDLQKSRQTEFSHMFSEQSNRPMQFDEMTNSRMMRYQQMISEQQSTNQLLTPNSATTFSRSRSVSSGSSGSLPRHQRGRSATVIGGNMPKLPGKRKATDVSQASSSSKRDRVSCKWLGCNKAGMRPCELKKHERRHLRPFGCTFDPCNKAFGSKNDWKRHESSQHFQEELWRCNQPHQPEGQSQTVIQSDLETINPCASVFYDREHLVQHLSDNHAVVDPEHVNQICGSQRIGRHFQGTFWCGFCRQVMTQKHTGRTGWDERFDHIGRHFHPEGMKIRDWLPSGGLRTKGEIQERQIEEAAESYDDDDEMAEDDDSEAVESPSVNVATKPTGSDALGISGPVSNPSPQVDPNGIQVYTSPTEETKPAFTQRKESYSRQRRQALPLDSCYCCACGDGPLSLENGICFCGHTCGDCFFRSPKRTKIEATTA